MEELPKACKTKKTTRVQMHWCFCVTTHKNDSFPFVSLLGKCWSSPVKIINKNPFRVFLHLEKNLFGTWVWHCKQYYISSHDKKGLLSWTNIFFSFLYLNTIAGDVYTSP